MKKILITIIAMLLPLLAIADANGTCGENLTWSYVEATNTLKISGTGEMTNYVSSGHWSNFDSSINNIIIDFGVTGIGDRAFYGCSSLTSVMIPNSVMSIGNRAFMDCSCLTSITIPNSVTSIGIGAFQNCSSLTSITIPNSVTSIEGSAFQNCSSLASVTIPNGVTNIGNNAFRGCSGLTTIEIPNSVTSIGSNAFYDTGWYNNQPDGLVYAGKVAYEYKGTMPDNTSIIIKDRTLGIANSAFSGCSGLTSITIPNSVMSIGDGAFDGCSGLTTIEIPNSVTSIGNNPFLNCSCLTSITVNSGNMKYDSRDNCNAIIEKSSNTLVAVCKNTIIPNSVTSIGDYAFYNCRGLTSITIPNSVTSIGSYAFQNCNYLTSITIGNSVTSIGTQSFYRCSGLTSITIPNSVTSIGIGAFGYCSCLTSVTIGNSVTSIGNRAFQNCSGLLSVTIPKSLTSIGQSVFSGCNTLTSIISLNNIPPTFIQDENSSFTQFKYVDKTNCVVWVAKGSVNAYKEADGWKDFQIIRELTLGDVNIDFEVNEKDLIATTSHIMGKDQEGFYENLADLNNDEKVNATDVVKLVTILNIQGGLSTDWQMNYSGQVVSSLTCTLNNDGEESIQLTKCELYNNNKLVSTSNFKVTLASGKSKKCSFGDLASLSARTGFSVVWYYTYNGESYTYSCDLTE